MWREDIEFVERRGMIAVGRGKFGREVCCFNVGTLSVAIGMVIGFRVGDGINSVGEVGGEVHDCVRR
jgi:hypothetical protein